MMKKIRYIPVAYYHSTVKIVGRLEQLMYVTKTGIQIMKIG